MTVSEIKLKSSVISDLIASNKINEAIDSLLDFCKESDDNGFKNAIIIKKANYKQLVSSDIIGTKDLKWQEQYNHLLFSLLELLDEIHKALLEKKKEEIIPIKTKDIKYSKSDILNKVENFVNKSDNPNNLTINEFEELYDLKVKLYKEIFDNFDKKIVNISHLKNTQTSILFERIIAFEKLEQHDCDMINQIRKNHIFYWYERVLIVSSLTLSLVNKFDIIRLNLLIDFLTDFEEKVWQRSLFGIIIGIYKFDKRLMLYPDTMNRLQKLKTIDKVQEGIDTLAGFFNEEIYCTQDFLHHLMSASYDKSGEIGFQLLATLSGKTYDEAKKELRLKEFIPFEIDFAKFGFLEKPQNWFLPFYENNELIRTLIDTSQRNVNLSKIIDKLVNTDTIDNFTKYLICLNFESLPETTITKLESDEDIFRQILNIQSLIIGKPIEIDESVNFTEYLFKSINNEFLSSIRDFYRFITYYPTERFANFFQDKIQIYKSKITDLMVEDSAKYKKIAANFEEGEDYENAYINYKKYVELTNDIDSVCFNLGWVSFCLKKFEEAKEYFLLTEKSKSTIPMELPHCFINLGHIELCLNNKEAAIEYYKKSRELNLPGPFQQEFESDYEHIKDLIGYDDYMNILEEIGHEYIDFDFFNNMDMESILELGKIFSDKDKLAELLQNIQNNDNQDDN